MFPATQRCACILRNQEIPWTVPVYYHAGNIGGYLKQDTFVIRQHVIDAVLGQLQVICQEGVVFSKQHFGSFFIVKKLNADDREKGHKE